MTLPKTGDSKKPRGASIPLSVSPAQSHKNPCSVAALLRGNFRSLVDFVEIFTNINTVLSLFSWKKNLFCWKISKNCCHLVWNFHKKLPFWLISTKKCLYGKFPQKSCHYEKFPQNFAWLESFHNNRQKVA